LPGGLRIRALDSEDGHFRRVDAIFLAVPSGALAEVAQSEALETVSLLARAASTAAVDAPVISALAKLIDGTLPLDDWVALVRTKQPEPARFAGGFWRRVAGWFRRVRARRRTRRPSLS
jgi:glycerol-3-phosphate dehydrogenase (NAD(P)+)